MTIPGGVHPLFAFGKYQHEIRRSLRFNSADSAYLSRTPGSAGNRKTWTWAGWAKRSDIGSSSRDILFSNDSGSYSDTSIFQLGFYDNQFLIYGYLTNFLVTTAVYRDPSAYYHVVVSLDTTQATASNRLKLYINGSEVTTFSTDGRSSITQNGDYGINQAVSHSIGRQAAATTHYFDGYLADIYFIDGQALTPSSFTETDATTGQLIPKAYTGSYGTNGFHLEFADNSAATAAALGKDSSGLGNNWTPNNLSVIQGTGSYTTNLTGTFAANRGAIKAFDGATSGSNFYAQPADGNTVTIGSLGITGITKLRMWLGKNNSGDPWGTLSLDSTNVTSFLTTNYPSLTATGQWIDLTSQLSGSSLSTITMTSPVANTDVRLAAVEVNDIVLIDRAAATTAGNDSLVDVPTSSGTDLGVGGEVRGNYCTLNPLNKNTNAAAPTNGNLDYPYNPGTAAWLSIAGTIGVTSGKYYWEITPTVVGGNGVLVGIANQIYNFVVAGSSVVYLGHTANSWAYYSVDGKIYTNSSGTSYGNSYTSNDVIGVALDMDSGKCWFSKNGTWQNSGSPTGGTNAGITGLTGSTIFPGVSLGDATPNTALTANFGQRAFAYTAPSGFKALCTANLPAPLVTKPTTVMDVLLWSGTGGNRSFTSLDMSPDFVWVKQRNAAFSTGHQIYDIVRGAGSEKELNSSGTGAEGAGNIDQYGWISSFDTNGFSVTAGPAGSDYVNASGFTYVAWCWDAGTSTVTNTQGSITGGAQVRVNATAGFSVVTWTSDGSSSIQTMGTGLNATPGLIIAKNRSISGNWWVWHSSFSNQVRDYLLLQTTDAKVTAGVDVWSTSSTTFGIRQATIANNTNQCVAYVFSPVVGYSSMGSYVGNGSSDGPFVYTGFRPRWVLLKLSSSSGGDWALYDTARGPYNLNTPKISPDSSAIEDDTTLWGGSPSSYGLDFLSNGFKLRNTAGGSHNGSGFTYIYAAFAESPFNYSRAR